MTTRTVMQLFDSRLTIVVLLNAVLFRHIVIYLYIHNLLIVDCQQPYAKPPPTHVFVDDRR